MRRIQVYAANDMKLRRCIEVDGNTIHGSDETGRVDVTYNETPMLFCPESSVTKGEMPWAFISDSLAAMMELDQSKKAVLLSILTTSDHGMIRDYLERSNLWKEEYVLEAPLQEDEDDHEELPKPAVPTDERTKESGIKKEASRASSEAASTAGKSQRTRSSTSSAARSSKPAASRSSSSSGARRHEKTPTAAPEPSEPPASRASLLIKAIEDAAQTYDMGDATFVGTSIADDQGQLDALDLLKSSFTVIKSEGGADENEFQGELFVSTCCALSKKC